MVLTKIKRHMVSPKDKKIKSLMQENSDLVSLLCEKDKEIYDLKRTVQMLSYISWGRVGLTEDTREALVKAVSESKDTCCPSEELKEGNYCCHNCIKCWTEAAKKFKTEKSVFMIDNMFHK